MNPRDDLLDPRLREKLNGFKSTPARDAQAAARRRANFLAEAESLRQAVPPATLWRRTGWFNLFQRKERFHMSTLTALIMALVVALGGSGATVYAAQSALPTDSLYPVKILSEDIQVSLTEDPEARANLLLDLANRRLGEIAALGAKGIPPTEPVIAREQQQIENALQIAASMDDATMTRELLRTRTLLRDQLRDADRLQNQSSGQSLQTLARVREMLTARLALVEAGLTDPQTFRARMREMTQTQSPEQQQFQPSPQAQPSPQPQRQQQQQQLQPSPQPQAQPSPPQQQQQLQPSPQPQAQPTPQQQQQQLQPSPPSQAQPTPQQQQPQQPAQSPGPGGGNGSHPGGGHR